MSLVHYPTTLPGVSRISVSGVPPFVASDNETGPQEAHAISRATIAELSVEWRFLETDYSVFIAWWDADLLQGHRRFYVALPGRDGVSWHLARFVDRPQGSRAGYGYWQVSAKLEIFAREGTYVAPASPLPVL